jgi:hypothetical protein
MKNPLHPPELLRWSSRALGMAAALFLALFALDAFTEGQPLAAAAPDFVIHLVPAALVFAIVAVAWRHALIGAVAFVGLSMLYAVWARTRVDWILVISGPLLATGLMYLASWRYGSAYHR